MNSLRQHLRERLWAAGAGTDFAADFQLDAAIKRRQHRCNTVDEHTYQALLMDSEQEQAALLDELLIRETSFFRDQTPFRLLAETVDNASTGVDVLCVACASGEEPYSIAMTLLDAGYQPEQIRIEAIDLSTRGIMDAREACYSESRLRLVSDEQKRRHFESVLDGRYRVTKRVRSCVRFHQLNALDVYQHFEHRRFNTIFCRNLMIYLRSECRDALLNSLMMLLKPEGHLFVGHAEAGLLLNHGYQSAGPIGCFAFRVPTAAPVESKDSINPSLASPALPPRKRQYKQHDSATKRSSTHVSTNHNPPTLTDIMRLADSGKYAEAKTQLLSLLTDQPDLAAAHSLLGLIQRAQGDLQGAIRCLEKALYLDGSDDSSIEHLTLLYEAAGDQAGWARMQRKRENLKRDQHVQ